MMVTNDLQAQNTENVYKKKVEEDGFKFFFFSTEDNMELEEKKNKLKNELEKFMDPSYNS